MTFKYSNKNFEFLTKRNINILDTRILLFSIIFFDIRLTIDSINVLVLVR